MSIRPISAVLIVLTLFIHSTSSVRAATQAVTVSVTPGQELLHADKKQRVWLKIALEGQAIEQHSQRSPVNVALVLDKSGSMQGEKFRQARAAAIQSLDYLSSQDILSLVVYSNTVDVPVPATRLTDKATVEKRIRSVSVGGNTALFAGVSKGAHELRKFFDSNQVNRIILLSDGLANEGPSTPSELGRLGRRLGGEGIAVTTIGLGLGYNEDLMVQLAGNSDGNHAFVEEPAQLAAIFESEFGDIGSVVAQDVVIKIQCLNGVKPIQVLNRDVEIQHDRVETRLNQLSSGQEKYLTLEVEVPAHTAGSQIELVKIEADWDALSTKRREHAYQQAKVSISESQTAVATSINPNVAVIVTEQEVADDLDRAVQLKDQGRDFEAREVLKKSEQKLQQAAKRYQSRALEIQLEEVQQAEEAVGAAAPMWNKSRKQIYEDNYRRKSQQNY